MDGFPAIIVRISRWLAVLAIGACVFAPMGCRSTRSSMARVPGMGWMASGEDVQFDGADPMIAGPTKPATQATPELASRSGGTTRQLYDDGPAASTDRVASNADRDRTVTGDYPDTGYPSPYDAARPSPQRGFYGSPDEGSDELASGADRYRSPTDDYDAADSADDYRSDDYAADDYASDDYESPDYDSAVDRAQEDASDRIDDLANRVGDARDRFSDATDSVRDRLDGARSQGQRQLDRARDSYDDLVTRDPDGSFDEARSDLIDRAADEVDRYRDEAAGLLEPPAGEEGLGGRANDLVDGMRDRVQGVARGVQDRVRGGVDSLSTSTQGLADGAGTMARDRMNQLERGAQELGEGVRDGVDRFGQGARDAIVGRGEEVVDSVSERASSAYDAATDYAAEGLDGARDRYEAVQDYVGDATEAVSPNLSPRSTPPRQVAPNTGSPWRPGGTRDYQDRDNSTTRRSSRVQPASYPGGDYPVEQSQNSRLTPTYR